ncbi:MAG: hypothetical protein JRG76_04485 [Deltaproteobacteria bacterium]|nr:hypothetical protein [Deltaproteobacteria bacterium]
MQAIRDLASGRPLWMNAMFAVCLYMTFVYMPFDLFWKPVAEDQEVWLGFMLTGWWAKATEPLHWAIYAAGSYGFWKMKRWMHPWAALYVAQIGIGMLVWSMLDERGTPVVGAVVFALFGALAVAVWRARPSFDG